MRTNLALLAFLAIGTTLAVACGDDDSGSPASQPRAGSSGEAGEGGETGTSGKGGKGGKGGSSGSGDAGSSSGGAGSGGSPAGSGGSPAGSGGSGPQACVTSPPDLPACDKTSGCLSCLCDKCSDDWAACMADASCKKAIACVVAGCSPSLCATITDSPESLAKAEAVENCRSSKSLCRTQCTGSAAGAGGSAGAGGAAAGSGGSPAGGGGSPAGSAGSPAGAGGSKPVSSPTCCELSEKPGCSGLSSDKQSADQSSVQTCVCTKDTFCCENMWDEQCVKEVGEFGCAPACPAGSGGSGGSAGGAGKGGSGGSGGNAAGSGGSTAGSGGAAAGSGGGSGTECSPACTADKVCDTNTGSCEECVENVHCQNNQFGPTCLGVSGSTLLNCGCSSNFDCKTHPAGVLCDQFAQFCGCANNNDCAEATQGKVCLEVSGTSKGTIKQCGCNVDADCASGKCIAFIGVCGE